MKYELIFGSSIEGTKFSPRHRAQAGLPPLNCCPLRPQISRLRKHGRAGSPRGTLVMLHERSLRFRTCVTKAAPSKPREVERADDRSVNSGNVHVLNGGCRWFHCPSEYGPPTTSYSRFVRWARRWRRSTRLSGCGATDPQSEALHTHARRQSPKAEYREVASPSGWGPHRPMVTLGLSYALFDNCQISFAAVRGASGSSQLVSGCYLPFQFGGRLLRKASMPSRKSWLM